jgi:hypothetical protein
MTEQAMTNRFQYYTGKNFEILEQIKGLALDVLTKVYAAYPMK